MALLTDDRIWLSWTGMETDLIFNQGVDLPHFAAFPMIDDEQGRDRLHAYYVALIQIGRDTGAGVILDTPTWMANPDRAALVGYDPDDLARVTGDSVAFAQVAARTAPDVATRVSVQIGPRGDGYAAGIATIDGARDYHAPQVSAARAAQADMVSAYTMGSVAEAAGIALAAEASGIAALISFTVETDGRLPDGTPLADAVGELRDIADPAAVMVNCAHPDHIDNARDGRPWQAGLAGIVANASRQSHEELDNATVLDDGDPEELGSQVIGMKRAFPNLRIVGGCCGTDLRHLREIARHASAP